MRDRGLRDCSFLIGREHAPRIVVAQDNVSGASVKNKMAVNKVAANQADDKTGSFETTKRREVTPAALL